MDIRRLFGVQRNRVRLGTSCNGSFQQRRVECCAFSTQQRTDIVHDLFLAHVTLSAVIAFSANSTSARFKIVPRSQILHSARPWKCQSYQEHPEFLSNTGHHQCPSIELSFLQPRTCSSWRQHVAGALSSARRTNERSGKHVVIAFAFCLTHDTTPFQQIRLIETSTRDLSCRIAAAQTRQSDSSCHSFWSWHSQTTISVDRRCIRHEY